MCDDNDQVIINNDEFQTQEVLNQIKTRTTAPQQLRIAKFNKKFAKQCPQHVLPLLKRDLVTGNAQLEQGMMVTLIAEVINPDYGDNTFQFNVVDPDDASIKECVDTFIGINYIAEDSPTLQTINKLKLCARIVKAQDHLASLEAEYDEMIKAEEN